MLPFLLLALSAPPAELPVAPPPRPAGIDPALADWTPRPAAGKAEPWERHTDADWIDARFRDMDTGPFLNCTMRYPLGKGQQTVYKATVVKLGPKGEAATVFDRNTLRLSAGWTGGYLNHSDRRFGLLNTPTPKGEMQFALPTGPGWASPKGEWATGDTKFTAPLPKEWAKYRGLYLHGDRVIFSYTVGDREVLDSPVLGIARGGKPWIYRFTEVQAGKSRLEQAAFNDSKKPIRYGDDVQRGIDSPGTIEDDIADFILKDPNLPKLTKGGPKRWGEPLVTKLVRGDESGPLAVDTLTIPYKNRFGALFFCTGLDHLPGGGPGGNPRGVPPNKLDGRVAVCTCHGDVWLVTVDEKAATCSWQRYATGLYHPLGLKVVDGKVVVLERGQLTRLHDLNDDGEADFYECVNNDWHCGGGEHSYDTCLETDPQGNFYFFKTGDTDTPTGGCLMRVSKDGTKSEVFATGFRHPIGMGMSPTGVLTGADQEGNWMPATRIDEYRRGGFYGDMRAHHRPSPPATFDPPLCWLPREVDNSAGGQVWVPKGVFGDLAGASLHFSYGRCRPYVLLRKECGNGVVQGGVAGLPAQFLSGVCRGRFGADGHLYVCGLNGWQTAAQADGCVQRVRATGKPLHVPVDMEVSGDTLKLTFTRPLDAKAVASADNYKAAWWNYRWAGEYGSKRYKVSDPKSEGQDDVPVRGAKLSADGRTLEITFNELKPVMQMMVGYNVTAADGTAVVGSVYLTINTTEKAKGNR